MATIPDFSTYTDDELARAETAIMTDRERRNALANTAVQVEQLTARFTEGGGDVAQLTAAVNRGKRPRRTP